MIMKIWYQPATWLPQLEIISEERKKNKNKKHQEQKADKSNKKHNFCVMKSPKTLDQCDVKMYVLKK